MEAKEIVLSKATEWSSTQFKRLTNHITGCYGIDPDTGRFDDNINGTNPIRGSNWESFHIEKFESMGIPFDVKQINKTRSKKRGVFRGLHFQYINPQAKLVECIAGKALVIIMDTRMGSPTFGNIVSGVLEPTAGLLVYAPPGVAHGFLALEDDTRYQYICSDIYRPGEERGITYRDSAIQTIIEEQTDISLNEIIANKRDTQFRTLLEAMNPYFDEEPPNSIGNITLPITDYLPRYQSN